MFTTQCAAVRIQSSSIIEPPHDEMLSLLPKLKVKRTCQGSCSMEDTFSPPTICGTTSTWAAAERRAPMHGFFRMRKMLN